LGFGTAKAVIGLQYVEMDQCNLEQTILRTVYLRGLH
jgi:hypothetical protein